MRRVTGKDPHLEHATRPQGFLGALSASSFLHSRAKDHDWLSIRKRNGRNPIHNAHPRRARICHPRLFSVIDGNVEMDATSIFGASPFVSPLIEASPRYLVTVASLPRTVASSPLLTLSSRELVRVQLHVAPERRREVLELALLLLRLFAQASHVTLQLMYQLRERLLFLRLHLLAGVQTRLKLRRLGEPRVDLSLESTRVPGQRATRRAAAEPGENGDSVCGVEAESGAPPW